jgi:hypothetical protein
MNNVTKLFSVVMMIIASSILEVRAQSYVTYNHDEAKMNQITVQEIGAGGLTPAFYYDVFHRSYQRSAGSKNKLTYRSLAGVAGWQQVDDADSVKASLEKRAEIEALNVADRQIDLAWLVEGTKITNKLNDFQNNINRIVSAGGTFNEKERWNDYYNIFQCAIKATRCYMPNAQRMKEYLTIYAESVSRMRRWSSTLLAEQPEQDQGTARSKQVQDLTIMEHTPELLTTDGVMPVGKSKMGIALPMEVPIPRMAQSL